MTSWAWALSLGTTMAPTPSLTFGHSLNLLSGRHHQLRRQLLGSSPRPPGHSSTFRTGQLTPRTLDPASQPSLMPEGPSPPPFESMPSQSVAFTSEPSIPVKNNQPQGSSQPEDIPGNIVVAVVVMVLILGGLVGLVIGGEMLRRDAKTTGKRVSHAPSRCAGRRTSVPIKIEAAKMEREKFPYNEKTLTPLTRPPPALNRERKRRLSDVWPIRSLSRVLFSRRSDPDQAVRNRQYPAPVASPQTTWSEFSPVLLYAAPPRTVLARIPEEHGEDVQGEIGVGPLQQLLESSPVVSSPRMKQVESVHDLCLKGLNDPEPRITTERPQGHRNSCTAGAKDEDTKSLGSSAPDMTADGGESSRSSIASLESLDDGRESVKEEVFELKRAQTRSMQMNKGVLLSLSLNIPPDRGTADRDGSSRQPFIAQNGVERELSLAMLGGSLSVVNLDEFPSPPSMLPVIPSFVSGF